MMIHLTFAIIVGYQVHSIHADAFKTQRNRLNSSNNCSPLIQNPRPGVNVSGERWCVELFAGRAYANYVCTLECNQQDMNSIDCGAIKYNYDGKKARNIRFTVTCSCRGGKVFGRSRVWRDAEDLFYTQCNDRPQAGARAGNVGKRKSGSNLRGQGESGGQAPSRASPAAPARALTASQSNNKTYQQIAQLERATASQDAILETLGPQWRELRDYIDVSVSDAQFDLDSSKNWLRDHLERLARLFGASRNNNLDPTTMDMGSMSPELQQMLRDLMNAFADLVKKVDKAKQDLADLNERTYKLQERFDEDMEFRENLYIERLTDLGKNNADPKDFDKVKLRYLNGTDALQRRQIDILKNLIEPREKIEEDLMDLLRRVAQLKNYCETLEDKVDKEAKNANGDRNNRNAVLRDAVNTINDLNYRLKPIEAEMKDIWKYMNQSKDGNSDNPKVAENYASIYNDHEVIIDEIMSLLDPLLQSFQKNQAQLKNRTNQFDYQLWQQLLDRLTDANDFLQEFTEYHYTGQHMFYDADKSVRNSVRYIYKKFFIIGQSSRPAERPLVDPSTYKINYDVNPKVKKVDDMPKSR